MAFKRHRASELRRIGNMIAAYYGKTAHSRPILENLKIAQSSDFETYLNAFNVIKIDCACDDR